MLRRRTAQGAAAAALLVGLLTPACTSADQTRAQPTPTTARASSPAPTAPRTRPPDALVALPTPTAAMDRPDQAGAEATAEYFVQLYDYVFATRQLGAWEALAADTCTFCSDVADDVRALDAGTVIVQAGPTTITSMRAWVIRDDTWFGADLVVEQPPTDQFDESGALVSSGGGGTVRLALAMSWDGGWRVDAVDALDPDEVPEW